MSSPSPGSPAGQLVSRLRGADLCPSELKCYWPSTPLSPSGLRPFVPASLLFQISHWEAKAAARGHPRSWNLGSQTAHYTRPFLGIPPTTGVWPSPTPRVQLAAMLPLGPQNTPCLAPLQQCVSNLPPTVTTLGFPAPG